ncbi:cadherin-related family member 5-like isoform X2 [Lampetra planeri]
MAMMIMMMTSLDKGRVPTEAALVRMHWAVRLVLSVWCSSLCRPAQAQVRVLCVPERTFVSVQENSAGGLLVVTFTVPPLGPASFSSPALTPRDLTWALAGPNSTWFYVDDAGGLRLDARRSLDAENMTTPVLRVDVTCSHGVEHTEHSILVQVTNLNDNQPRFERDVYLVDINELSPVDSTFVSVKATDLDGDAIRYVLDPNSNGVEFFTITLPGSGRISLHRPLDFEELTDLRLIVYAEEFSTTERYRATATVWVTVRDGDDMYPHFLPCRLSGPDGASQHGPGDAANITDTAVTALSTPLCLPPTYNATVRQGEIQTSPFVFSPGPILAEDGDKGLNTRITYTIAQEEPGGHVRIDAATGNVTLVRAVRDRFQVPQINLQIMAAQVDDPRKFAVAVAVVRVVSLNRWAPAFPGGYEGFVRESSGDAVPVFTTRESALRVHALDRDFPNGLNPRVEYSLIVPAGARAEWFYVTHEGFVLARGDALTLGQSFALEVVATDQESFDVAKTSLNIEVIAQDVNFYRAREMGILSVVLASCLAVACAATGLMYYRMRLLGHKADDPLALKESPYVVAMGVFRPKFRTSHSVEGNGGAADGGCHFTPQDQVANPYATEAVTAGTLRDARTEAPDVVPPPATEGAAICAASEGGDRGPAGRGVRFHQDEVAPGGAAAAAAATPGPGRERKRRGEAASAFFSVSEGAH